MSFDSLENVVVQSDDAADAFFWGLLLLTPWIVVPLVHWWGQGPRLARDAAPGRIGLARRLGDVSGWAGMMAVFAGPMLFGTLAIVGITSRWNQCEFIQPRTPPARILLLLGLEQAGGDFVAGMAAAVATVWFLLALWWRMDVSPLDVVKAAAQPSRRFLGVLQDLLPWTCIAVLFMSPLLLGLSFLLGTDAVLLDFVETTFVGVEPPYLGCFAAAALLGILLRVKCLRSNASHRDVLHIA